MEIISKASLRDCIHCHITLKGRLYFHLCNCQSPIALTSSLISIFPSSHLVHEIFLESYSASGGKPETCESTPEAGWQLCYVQNASFLYTSSLHPTTYTKIVKNISGYNIRTKKREHRPIIGMVQGQLITSSFSLFRHGVKGHWTCASRVRNNGSRCCFEKVNYRADSTILSLHYLPICTWNHTQPRCSLHEVRGV